MSKLFIKGTVIIFLAIVFSFVMVMYVLHVKASEILKESSPGLATYTSALIEETTHHMSKNELSDLVFELKTKGHLIEVVNNDHPSVTPEIKTRISQGKPFVEIKKEDESKWFKKEMNIYMPVENKNRVLIFGPQEPVMPPLNAWIMALVIIIVVVFITTVVIFGPIYKRLKGLELAAQKITAGDLDTRVEVRYSDAVSSLSKTFNEMVSRIQYLLENQRHLILAVAHELRTPIARVRFGIEMLGDGNDEKDEKVAKEKKESIESDLKELDLLVEELLIYSRYDSGKAKLEPCDVDVLSIIQEQIERASGMYPKIEMKISKAGKFGDNFTLDQRSLERVVGNLLGNAARYAKDKIEVNLAFEKDILKVEVNDDGQGILPEDRKRVLEPFVRIDNSRNRSSGGVGLGLAIVKRIVEKNAGEVYIETSNLGGAKVVTTWKVGLKL